MNCNSCGRSNDNESNFCKFCGTNLKDVSIAATDPHHTIFGRQEPSKPNSDLGYMIIAVIIIVNILIWFFWGLVFRSIVSGNEIFYSAIRVISLLFSTAQFVVMFIFTKRQSYRIVIGIIAGLVILYNLYILIVWYNRF